MKKKNPLTSKFKLHTSYTQKHLTQWLPTLKKKNPLTSKFKPQSFLKPLRIATSFTTQLARQLFTKKHLTQRTPTLKKKNPLTSKFKPQSIVKKKNRKSSLRITTVLALAVIAVATTCTTFAALSVSQNVSSSGSITVSANLGIYSDSACQNSLTTINWGTLNPGGNITRTICIKNTGMGASLTLSMATSGWNPTNANGLITITWNQEGKRLAPSQSTLAVLTLTVSPTIADITNFSVQISIAGTQ
jgi:hypothetical protein